MIKVTGLWLNESKDGEKYFSGSMGNLRVIIFKNSYKESGDNQPDYVLYFDEQLKKPAKLADVPDDDVPF